MKDFLPVIICGVCVAAVYFFLIDSKVPVDDVIKMAGTTYVLNEKNGLIPKHFSLHWTVDNTYKRKIRGETWKGVDITFYYVSPSLGKDSPWDEVQKKVKPQEGSTTFSNPSSNYSVRAFSGTIAYIKRGNRYHIEYLSGDDVINDPDPAFHAVPDLWQYKYTPKNGDDRYYSRNSRSLDKVIEEYCRIAHVKRPSFIYDLQVTDITKNKEHEALFPYKGICKFGREHEIEVFWSSITEDWLAFRYGGKILRCD